MKEFHNFVYKHIVTLKNHKRYIAMLTALSIFVSFMVPLILIEPADSMTKQRLMMLNKTSSGMAMVDNLNGGQTANNNYSPSQLSEVALLIGEFTPGDYETKLEWVEGCTTAAEVVEAAKREYFLGIASDFCVFLEGNLTITNADAEGRVAVGGNIYFDRDGDNNISNDYNYQLGSGDYQNMTALINTDNYQGISNFAHAIVAGSVENLNTLSSVGADGGWTGREDANSLKKAYDKTQNPWKLLTVYFPEDEDLYKRFVVGDMANSSHITWPNGNASATAYQSNCSHDEISVNELAQFYQRDNLIDFGSVFDWLETQSEKLSIKRSTGTATWDGNTLNLVGNGNNGDETIYFNVEDWNNSVNKINISNVPDDANIVINCGETEDIKIGREGENDQFSTYFNGVAISRIDASGAETSYKNNSKKSEQILYNFYNVGKNDGDSEDADIYIDANFNGSILAPYANVKSGHSCGGHLSGALIAQTFRGGLEFGYRPYRGGTDILGSTAGYVVPFDKFVDDLNEDDDDNPSLAGATFEIKDESGKVVDTWTSTEETSYITFPTELDFTGGKTYNETNQTVTHTYTISEKSAPEGYAITTETYSVEVKETVDLNYLLSVDGGTIPTRAAVEIKIFKNAGTNPVYSCNMIIEDTYSDSGIIQRIIAIDGDPKEYYVLDITNGEINSVGTPTDPSDLEYIWTVTANEEVDVQAMNVDGVDVLEDDTNSSGEDTEEATEESTEETEEPTQSENQEETVEKTDPPIPTGLTIEYGKALNTVALPDGWTWNSPNDTVSETAGSTVSHKAKYTPSETSNYNAVERDITLTVEKTDPPIPTGLTIEYGKALNTVALPDGWTWNSPNDTVSETAGSSATYKATYTPSDTNNYNIVEKDITLIVTKAQPTVNPVLDPSSGYTQGDTLPTITISNGDTAGTISWVNSTAKLKYGENVLAWEFSPTDENYDTLTRTIRINAEAIETTEIRITDKKASQKLTDSNFYYDPTSLMIMPLPNKTPSFTNDYALVFEKVSGDKPLSGADIKLQVKNSNGGFDDVTATDVPSWNWTDKPSSCNINITDIAEGEIYKFYEVSSPDAQKYEIANPIYFKRDGLIIKYAENEAKLNNNDCTSITLPANHTITMDDKEIFGPEIKLLKVKEGTNTTLEGAQFELYAVSGDTLVYPTNYGNKLTSGSDGTIDFTDVFKANPDKCNEDYIKNGYLIPGEYYLKETTAPNGYEAPTDKMYFVVNEDYTVEAEKVEKPDAIEITLQTVSGDNANKIWLIKLGENVIDGEANSPTISGVKTIEVKLKDNNKARILTAGKDEDVKFDEITKISKTTFPDNGKDINKLEIMPSSGWNPIEIEYITITTSDGTVYTSDLSTVGDTTPTAYTLTSDSIGLAVPSSYQNYTLSNGDHVNKQVWAEGTVSDANKIEIIFDSPKSGEFYIYDNNAIPQGPHKIIDGQGTVSFNNADISKFKIQTKEWDIDIIVREVRVYSASSSNNPTEKPNIKITKLTAHYLNGDTKAVEAELNASDTVVDNAYPFDISQLEDKESIIGLTLEVTGSDSGQIIVNDSSGEQIWSGNVTFDNGAETATVTLGRTDYTPPAAETGNSTLISVKENTTDTLLVGNNKAGANTNIKVEKEWSDSENLYNTRPTEIRVKLKRDGVNFNIPNTESPILTLTAENNWQAELNKLPGLKSGVAGEQNAEYYQYSFVEIDANGNEIASNSSVNGYTVTYDNPIQSGVFTITNTLKTTGIPVEKKWMNSDGSTATPNINQITVKLQKNNGSGYSDFLDKNGNVVTLVLGSNNNWSGEFTAIPEGDYQVVESVVPSGWTESRTTKNGKTIITNTQETGSLRVQKIWSGGSVRPEYITVNIYRTTTPPNSGTTGGDTNVNIIAPLATKYGNVTEDYARLLQYSLYFYDANMCGDTNSILSWRSACHIGDEVDGGFHDAGDHVMFGLPQGFTASTLGWSYYEFKDSFDKLGITKHYQVIMKEFCDFFVASTTLDASNNVTNFLYQKGNGDTDHAYWGSPEQQAVRNSEMYYTNNSASDIAAEYAAALAIHYLNFPNDENAETYLTYAKALYEFSTKYNSCLGMDSAIYTNKEGRYFYESTGEEYKDDQAWAGVWLYLITKDSKYLIPYNNYLSGNSINWVHCWDNVSLGTACVYAEHIDNNHDWTVANTYINNMINNTSYYNNGNKQNQEGKYNFWWLDKWGSARYNTTMQLAALVASTYSNTDSIDYTAWCKDQMAYILGDNSIASNGNSSTCFVVGFADNSALHPHHRASSMSSENVLVGALVGGPESISGAYHDSKDDYTCNEVALDYNAGLVGAAAALYSVYETGNTVTKDVMVADGLETSAEKIYEEDAYSQQARTANIEYNAVGPVNLSKLSFKRNTVSVLSDIVEVAGTEFNKNNNTYEYDITKNEALLGETINEIDVIVTGSGGGQLSYNYKSNYNVYDRPVKSTSVSSSGTYTFNLSNITDTPSVLGMVVNNGDLTIEKVIFKIGGSSDPPEAFAVEQDSVELNVNEPTTLTANRAANWSSSPNDGVNLTVSEDKKSCTVQITKYISQPITITANEEGGSGTDTVTINVNATSNFSVSLDKTAIHTNGTAKLTVINAEDGVSFECANNGNVVNYVNIDPITNADGEYTITLNPDAVIEESTPITITAKDNSNNPKTLTLTIVPDITITSNDEDAKININDELLLTANNLIGNTATWEIIEGTDVIEFVTQNVQQLAAEPTETSNIENGSAQITVKGKGYGTAIVEVTDTAGGSAQYTIKVEIVPVDVNTDGLDPCGTLTITSAYDWTATMYNLPKYDANGNLYYYYIEEVMTNGDHIAVSGGKYVPVSYINGTNLNSDKTLAVTNAFVEVDEQGTLPSTGGSGVKTYYYFGGALMLLGIAGFTGLKRRERRRREE